MFGDHLAAVCPGDYVIIQAHIDALPGLTLYRGSPCQSGPSLPRPSLLEGRLDKLEYLTDLQRGCPATPD